MSEEYLTEILEDLPPNVAIGVSSTSFEGKNLRIDVNKDSLPDMVAHLNRRYHVTLISQHATDEREYTSCFCLYTIFSLAQEGPVPDPGDEDRRIASRLPDTDLRGLRRLLV